MSQNNLELIPIYKSSLPRPEKWLDYLEIAYRNSKFSNFGQVSHLLEKRVADFLGMNESSVVTCVNATQALTGAISTAEKNNLDWTIPSWTFTATAASMLSAGREFYFSDVDANWRVLPNKKNVNVVDVLPFGEDIDLERVENLCSGEVIIDGAASFDALRYSFLSSIKRRFALVISFHPTKFPSGPEGAVFISNDLSWCERFRYWTIFGMDEQRESYFAGTNAKLNEFSASVILASFDAYENTRLDLSSAARKAMEISDQNNLEVHNAMKKGFASPYWIIKSNPKRILEIESTFDMVSISTRRWWMKGCHRMQAYSAIPSTDLKNTNAASDSSIGLPFYPNMNEVEWDRINEAIRRA